jgi:hypothetical protein
MRRSRILSGVLIGEALACSAEVMALGDGSETGDSGTHPIDTGTLESIVGFDAPAETEPFNAP